MKKYQLILDMYTLCITLVFNLFFAIVERGDIGGGRMVAPIFFLIIVRHLLWVYRPDAFFLTSGLSWVEGQESLSRNLLQYNYRCGWGLQNHFFINMYVLSMLKLEC